MRTEDLEDLADYLRGGERVIALILLEILKQLEGQK